MLGLLGRSRSHRGGRGAASAAASGPASAANAASMSPDAASSATAHAGGPGGKPHGPNPPLPLLSTMVVPSAAPAFVIPKAAAASESTALSAPPFSSSASSFSSSSLSSNTAASSVSTSSIEPGLVSKPTLQTSTVLGLVETTAAPSPPSPGLDGKRECPYVNRPLPPPPPPKDPSTMPSRPNTSAGAASKRPVPGLAASRPSAVPQPLAVPSATVFNRRISRDDMFLGTQIKKATAFDKRISRDDFYLGTDRPARSVASFHIPLRAAQQQPATLHEDQDFSMAPQPPFAMHNRRATPESLLSGEIQIGMALGSPVHASAPNLQPFRQQQQQHVEPATYAEWAYEGARSTDASAAVAEAPKAADAPLQRSRTTRKKLFGIFGSKRHHDPVKSTIPSSSSAYSLEASESSSIVMTSAIATSNSYSTGAQAAPAERPSTRGGNKKYQPIIIQIEPEPAIATNILASNGTPTLVPSAARSASPPAPAPTASVKEGRRPFLRSKASEPALRKRPEISNPIPISLGNSSMMNTVPIRSNYATMAPPPPMLGTSPYLDVEIPEARMERYSIMFGNLLGNGPSWQPASSLLARRQATLDKLKTINDRIHQEDLERDRANAAAAAAVGNRMNGYGQASGLPTGGLQRRVTSPHVSKSPSFSLFPNRSPNPTNGSSGTSPRSPLMRSNTTPARSPARTGFDFLQPPSMAVQPAPLKQAASRVINPLRENPTGIARRPVAGPAASSVLRFDPSQSSLILDSPTGMEPSTEGAWDEKLRQAQQPFRPVIQEPQWQMISPPTTASTSRSMSNNSSAVAGLAPTGMMTMTLSPASTASMELGMDDADPELKSAVEISIARQISISRQQRQLLRPLKPANPAPPSTTMSSLSSTSMPASGPSRIAALKLGRNERLQETRSATPRLVAASEADSNYSYSSKPAATSGGAGGFAQVSGQSPQQRLRYISPRTNADVGGSGRLNAYNVAQNRKSERVILEAA